MKHTYKIIFSVTGLLVSIAFTLIASLKLIQPIEKPIVVIIPSYNNSQWYEKNLKSVFMQKYDNYRVVYIDDCSSDSTGKLVEQYINAHDCKKRTTLIRNTSQRGALANLYDAIHACADHEIIATLDGDDWFANDHVLATINKEYNDKVFLTFGQFQHYSDDPFLNNKLGFCKPYPDQIVGQNLYRKFPWVASHLRTFYAGLFKQIKKEDLMYKGHFFPVTWDMAMMFPMLEMAAGRCKCLDDVSYIYNSVTPSNDFKLRFELMQECEKVIRARPAYEPLNCNVKFVQS